MTRILLVDDEAAICMLLSDVLSEAGYTVTDALTPVEAYGALERQGPEFEVLVTDVNVAERGWGFVFARAAREANPELAVIFVTGDSEASVRREGVAGAIVLPKPFLPDQLVQAVDNAIGRAGRSA